MFKNIDTQEFQKIQSGDNVVVLDVRTAQEVAEGHIEGSENYDVLNGEFMQKVDSFDKDKTYLVYCRSGARSANACSVMDQKGFEKVYNLDGGILGWQGDIKH